jgi:hypothetical protein
VSWLLRPNELKTRRDWALFVLLWIACLVVPVVAAAAWWAFWGLFGHVPYIAP